MSEVKTVIAEEIEKLKGLEKECFGKFFEAYKITHSPMDASHWQYKMSEVNAKIEELGDSI